MYFLLKSEVNIEKMFQIKIGIYKLFSLKSYTDLHILFLFSFSLSYFSSRLIFLISPPYLILPSCRFSFFLT